MKELVYRGPGSRAWDEVPDPKITARTDIFMWVDAATAGGALVPADASNQGNA